LDKQFCSFKTNAMDQKICKHPMNIYQICKMMFCPLANSRYATVIEKKGQVILCIKTVERSHLPSKLWDKILLDRNQEKALEQIEKYLQFWDKREIKRCKLRFMKITEYLKRMRKIRARGAPKFVTVKKKVERRLRSREKRALSVAQVENKIQAELLERLKSGVYGDLYKFNDKEKEKENGSEEEEEEENEQDLEFVAAEYSDEDLEDEEEDLEDIYNEYEDLSEEEEEEQEKQPKKKRKHLNIEYEKI
jgi:protein MAK16